MSSRKLSRQTAVFYLISFLIPSCLYSIMILSQYLSSGETIDSFSYIRILMLGISSMAFAFYLKHTDSFHLPHPAAQLAFAASYGLSSYILAQEGKVLLLCAYSFFPVLFLCYEWMLAGRRQIPFIIGNALFLLICPMAGIPVTILLYLLSFPELHLRKRFHLGDLLHIACNFILSIITGAFGIIFYLAPYYADHMTFSYAGFQLTNDLPIFLSRFFPGSLPSPEFYYHSYKIDLYFGFFAMIFTILFFFQHQIAFRKRLYYGIFSLLIIAGIELTPLQYLLDLLVTSERDTIVYSFFLVFWALRLAAEGYARQKQINRSSIFRSTCVVLVFLGITWCFGGHNFPSWMLIAHLVLLIAAIIFLLYCASGKYPSIHKSLFCLMLIELCFNAVIVTNSAFRPTKASSDAGFFYGQSTESTDPASSAHLDNEEEYQEYVSSHTDPDISQTLSQIQNLYSQKTSDSQTGNTELALANSFETYNTYVHELGIARNLFNPCDVTFLFPDHPVYTITDQGHHIYHIACTSQRTLTSGFIPYTIQSNGDIQDPVYLSSYFNDDMLKLDDALLSGGQAAYLPVDIPDGSDISSYNDQILCYSMDTSVLNELLPLLEATEDDAPKTQKRSHLKADIVGLIISYFGFMALFVLLFYNDKEELYQKLQTAKTALSNASLPHAIARHLRQNTVYYLAFLLPALMILGILVATDCMPFGGNSMFDEDGLALVLPEYLDYHYNASQDNLYLSMHSGYAANSYNNSPLIGLYRLYQYLTPSQIIVLQHFILLVCVGFAGVSMVFFLVHRQNRPASRYDLRLLLPAMVYSANAFMLRCHSFNTWYYVYLMFPLLLIALERLLACRKWFFYTLLLSCCIILNIQCGLYICIFLVIYFFCQPFRGFRDFLTKGIRFAWSSLLAAGCSFFVISNTLLTAHASRYQQEDAILPAPGFFGNFLEEWKNYMACSPVSFVSRYDGDLFAYCGIITLLLTAVYFISRQYSWHEKLRRIIPVILLTVSFNEQLLSYLWNGMHYQSNVPSRYTFLLMLLLAEIAYDAIQILPRLSRRTYALITMGTTVFFLCCQTYAQGNTVTAFSVTMALLVLYLLFHLWHRHSGRQPVYIALLLCIGISELYCNGIYTGSHWDVSSIAIYGNYEELMDKTTGEDKQEDGFYRTNFPLNSLINAGKVFHTNATGAFNSYVTDYQGNLNTSYGFISSINNITNHSISNPMGLSQSAVRYIYVYVYDAKPLPDLKQYQFLGYCDNYYIFENPYYLSLGYYVPESALNDPEKDRDALSTSPLRYQNLLVGKYLGKEQALNEISPIDISKSKTGVSDEFYVIDEYNNEMTIEESTKRYQRLDAHDEYRLKLHINYTVPCDGYLYLYANEIIGLGYVRQGQAYQSVINFPNLNPHLTNPYYIGVFREDVFQKFHQQASRNQLENVTVGNDTITGTTNYDTDGYTMLSIPYDRGWTAYIDGKETEIENPYDAGIYVKTPAGQHTLSLRFVPYGMRASLMITAGFWILAVLLAAIGRKKDHRHPV